MKNKSIISFSEKSYEKQLKLKAINNYILLVLSELNLNDSYISLTITDNQTIKQLNKEYRGKDVETDILSFSQIEGEEITGDTNFLGDIVISFPYALEQAKKLGHDIWTEFTYLIIHGILHLLGYDHDVDETGEMSIMEKEIYKSITGDEII